MDARFKALICDLPQKYIELMSMRVLTIDTVPFDNPRGGVYLFTENGDHLYAGRTKRRIKERLKYHVGTGDDCPFAWRLAREETGNVKATYKVKGSRKDLLNQPHFRKAYQNAKKRINLMGVRYIGEPDPLKQTLLEIYVAVVSGAKFNDFDTH
jgi:hypothetical protein